MFDSVNVIRIIHKMRKRIPAQDIQDLQGTRWQAYKEIKGKWRANRARHHGIGCGKATREKGKVGTMILTGQTSLPIDTEVERRVEKNAE